MGAKDFFRRGDAEHVTLGGAEHGLLLSALTAPQCRCCELRVSVSVNFSVPDWQDLETKKEQQEEKMRTFATPCTICGSIALCFVSRVFLFVYLLNCRRR